LVNAHLVTRSVQILKCFFVGAARINNDRDPGCGFHPHDRWSRSTIEIALRALQVAENRKFSRQGWILNGGIF
jgi:hypothetical protein